MGVMADQPSVDFAASQARKQKVVNQLWKGLQGTMKAKGVKTLNGTGTLGPRRVVSVDDGTQLEGDAVILATGSVPRTLPGFEVDGRRVLTSDHVLDLERLPASAAVIGGGAIGCELSSMMSDLGTEVTLLEALPQLLTGCDPEVVDVLSRSFRRRRIGVRTGVPVHGSEPEYDEPERSTVRFGDGETVTVDTVVLAVGRRPLSEGIGLEDTAVEVDERGFVVVDEHMRTGEEGVWAVGDLVNTPQLAHVGFAEAIVAVGDALGENPPAVDYGKVPWCIYSHPEVAFAGLTEEGASQAGHDVVVSKHAFNGGRAMILGETQGLVKVVAERGEDGRAGALLGVHMVGPWVTEQLAEAYLAVNWEATADEVASLVHPHPTLSETFGEAVMALTGRGLHG
jgi:dihydrolipoamide dehydrogenase